jgi:hypothetical protein
MQQWFRMYAEFATDPKVQMLSETDQRRYIMILCLKCSNGDVTLHETEVAFQLRISNEELTATKQRLMDKNLIDENFQPVAWDKRQYKSDSSAERVRKHREKQKQQRNVTVTPPDTDTDTDNKKSKPKKEKLNLPDFINKNLWGEWMQVRVRLKAVNSDTAKKSLINNLEQIKASGRDANEAIRTAIENSWKSIKLEWLENQEAKGATHQRSDKQSDYLNELAAIPD